MDNHYAREKCNNCKNLHLDKNYSKFKKHIFALISPFYNFNLPKKPELSWTKKFVKFILGTWNVSDVIVYVWFIYFRIKKLKIYIEKKNNFKCTKFTKKTKIIQIESKVKPTTSKHFIIIYITANSTLSLRSKPIT